MKKSLFQSRRRRSTVAFTLVELLVVLAIIILLAGVASPAYSMAIHKAQSLKCSTNLRSIGTAVSLAASDNNNTYPEINQTAPPLPYPGNVGGIVSVLGPYGISTNSVECPVDMGNGSASSFAQYGSSYEWNPVFDDEIENDPVIYIQPGTPIPVNNARVRLCTDFNSIHRGRANGLYGDGHVTIH
jgi:prepilin-type processing-associated H-X9-DG protein